MIFPLRILWNLKLSLVRKISIMAIFGVGVVCILTSIIRVSQISSRAKSRQPSPSWLIVWAIVEAAIGKSLNQPSRQPTLTYNLRSGRGSLSPNLRPSSPRANPRRRLRLRLLHNPVAVQDRSPRTHAARRDQTPQSPIRAGLPGIPTPNHRGECVEGAVEGERGGFCSLQRCTCHHHIQCTFSLILGQDAFAPID